MFAFNRIITNGSLPRDKRQTSPSPCSTPTLTRFAFSIANANIQKNIGSVPNYKTAPENSFPNNMSINPPCESRQSPSSPFLPASESDLKSIFGFDSRNGMF